MAAGKENTMKTPPIVSEKEWQTAHQQMLVNENRLSLADPRARKWLAEQMEKHFFGGGAEMPAGYVPPTP